MKPQEIFKIIVATAGLVGLCEGSIFLIRGLLYMLNLYPNVPFGVPTYYVIRGFIELMLGLILMKLSPFIVNIAFPYPDQQDKSSSA